ncbi:DUF1801 domain-containing protein [Brevibacterium daeguense]|uniref:DUF1801 domain-containing protein n=1 Tax=Brevibacterium daeguense TaxID=909936 RepID=A0ABP8EIJ3_9MICO|nr:hypothetical protein [Brevibacterium daeguense]
MSDTTGSVGFSEAEREAMKARAAELRVERGGKKKADFLQALMERIDEMPPVDQEIAVAVHSIVTELAPELTPRTWYSMPAYEKDGNVVIFLQDAAKFGTRYATLGFNDSAQLDDGDIWLASYAIPRLTDSVKEKIAELVARAVGQSDAAAKWAMIAA